MLSRIAALLIVLGMLSPAFAATVSMNFRFNVDSVSNDAIHVNETTFLNDNVNQTMKPAKPYISSEYAGKLVALAFAGGGFLNIRLDTQSDPYLFRMTQEETDNRFILAVTNGTWQKIDQLAGSRRVPQQTLGLLPVPFSNPQNIYLRLSYDTLNLMGSVASGQLLVKNLGSRKINLDLVG